MNLNDPLRTSAQGVKNDYSQKIEKYYSQNNNSNVNYSTGKHKRYYPADKKGQIDEWKAIVDTQVEDANIKRNLENKQKRDIQSNYHAELDYMRSRQDDQKYLDNHNKNEERAFIDQSNQAAQTVQKQMNREDKEFKHAIGQSYIQEMAEHKRKLQEEKQRDINEDNISLKGLNKLTQKELLEQKMQKLRLKYDRDNDIKLKNEIKDGARTFRQQEKEDYNQMVKNNIENEVRKEQEYRDRFRKFDNNKNVQQYEEFMKSHASPKNIDWGNETAKRQEELLKLAAQTHQNETKKNYDIVKQQLERKQIERTRDIEFQRKAIEQRFKDDDFNRKLDKMEKEENKKNQLMYQDVLNRQVQMKLGSNYGTMTKMEKRLNKTDLQGYKKADRRVHSLIPGINHINSIGSKPL